MDAWSATLRRLLPLLAAAILPLAAQEAFYERPSQQLTPQEREAVQFNRKLAKPRTPSPGPSLSPAETARVKSFKRARNAVVSIQSTTRNPNPTNTSDLLLSSSGTGFVWDNLGHIVTNHHVITYEAPETGLSLGEADSLQVKLADGSTYKAVVIGRSLARDIAVLHVFAPLDKLKPLPVGTSKDLIVGQDVMAIGNPYGYDHTLTTGVVSGLGRDIITNFNTHITNAIQTDAAINPGNSGGPLLDRAGRLIGMNTAITSSSGGSTGVGFAIPADTLNQIVPQLIAKGQIYRPQLGFTTLANYLAKMLGLPKGAVVEKVMPGSLAEAAGLRPATLASNQLTGKVTVEGDIIVGCNGTPVETDIQLMDLLELIPAEQPLEFDLLRDGKPAKVIIKPPENRERLT